MMDHDGFGNQTYSMGDVFRADISEKEFALDRWQYETDEYLFTNLNTGTSFLYPRQTFEFMLEDGRIIKMGSNNREVSSDSPGPCKHPRKSFIGLSAGRWACTECGEWVD